MNWLKTGWANLTRFVDNNSANILIGLGVGGIFVTTWRAISDTLDAEEALEEKMHEVGGRDLSFKEKVVTVAPCYISTVLSAAATTACVIGGSVKWSSRFATVAGLLEARNRVIFNYDDAIKERDGEEGLEEIRHKLHDSYKNEEGSVNYISKDTEDEVWFIDSFGQRFKATWCDVLEAENYICKLVMDQMCATVNDFYERLQIMGVKVNTCDAGDACEWTVEYPPTISTSDECTMIDGIPHVLLEYKTDPRCRWK